MEIPAVRRTQPSTKRPKFLQQPMSICYNGYMVNNNNLGHKCGVGVRSGQPRGQYHRVEAGGARYFCRKRQGKENKDCVHKTAVDR